MRFAARTLALLVVASAGCGTQHGGNGRLTMEPDAVDFGQVAAGTTAERLLVLRNEGSGPLRLDQRPRITVLEGCAMPEPELHVTTLQPSESIPVHVQLEARPGCDGTCRFDITVRSDDPSGPARTAHVSGVAGG